MQGLDQVGSYRGSKRFRVYRAWSLSFPPPKITWNPVCKGPFARLHVCFGEVANVGLWCILRGSAGLSQYSTNKWIDIWRINRKMENQTEAG